MNLNLRDRASLVGSMTPGEICVEIGVLGGDFAEVIWEKARPSEMWLVDCWQHNPTGKYTKEVAKAIDEGYRVAYDFVVKRFVDRPNVHILREFSGRASTRFADGFFDWVYIDADHTEVYNDLLFWWPTVRPGGWVLGHDYEPTIKASVVKRDVERFVDEHSISEVYVTGGDVVDGMEQPQLSFAFQKPSHAFRRPA